MSRSRVTVALAAVLAGFVVLSVLKTWPLVRAFGTHVPGDACDPLLLVWMMAWDVHALVTHPLRLFDANIFYPAERALAFSDHMLGALPIFGPVYLATGNPIAAYNTVFVLSFALSAFAGFCLAWYWTGAFWPSIVGGALFGFAPYRYGHISHLQFLNFFWAPFVLVFLDRFLRTRRSRDLAVFTLALWLQMLSTLYLAFLTLLTVVVYVAYHVVAIDRGVLSAGMVKKASVSAAVSVLVLGPLFLPYLLVNRAWSATRTISGILGYSADVLSYVTAAPGLNDVYLHIFSPRWIGSSSERALFPGLVLVGLVLIGSRAAVHSLADDRVRRLRRTFGLLIVVAVVLSLGPFLIILGHRTRIPLPYLVLYYVVPGWSGMRAPGRLASLAVLAAAPIATLGAMRCAAIATGWHRSPVWSRLAPAVTSLGLLVLLFAELGSKPLALAVVPAMSETQRWLARARPGPIVELPLRERAEYGHVYLSTGHWLPIVNGHSSFLPYTYRELRQALGELPAPRAIQYARALGLGAVVVHGNELTPREQRRWAALPPDGPLRPVAAFGSDAIYALPPAAGDGTVKPALASPDWLPAGQRVRLGLTLESEGERAWVHPPPQGESTARVRWTEASTGRVSATSIRVELPPAVPPGEVTGIPLRLETPRRPGHYVIDVAIPLLGSRVSTGALDVRASPLPTSWESRELRAVYALTGGAELARARPAEQLSIDVSATNTGRAMWLSRGTNNRGEVSLAWRWLDGSGREVSDVTDRSRVRYDVFPGQRYDFRVLADAPADPGRYTLELGLVSDQATSFERVVTPPLRLGVEVRGTLPALPPSTGRPACISAEP